MRRWVPPSLAAQEQPDPRTLIPPHTLNAHRAAHLRRAGAQPRARDVPVRAQPPARGISGHLSRVGVRGGTGRRNTASADVHIERFPLGGKQWDGEMAELWVTEPGPPQLITRYRDMPTTLATGSRSGDVTAELVYVGTRRHRGRLQRQERRRARSSSSPARSARRTTWPSASSAPRASSASSTARASRSTVPTRWDGAASTAGGRRSAREDDVGLHPVAADGARPARRASSDTSTSRSTRWSRPPNTTRR